MTLQVKVLHEWPNHRVIVRFEGDIPELQHCGEGGTNWLGIHGTRATAVEIARLAKECAELGKARNEAIAETGRWIERATKHQAEVIRLAAEIERLKLYRARVEGRDD